MTDNIIEKFLSNAGTTRLLRSLSAHNDYQQALVSGLNRTYTDAEREEMVGALKLSIKFCDKVIQELYKRESL